MKASLIDTHAHLDLEHFGSDIDELISRSEIGRFPDVVSQNIPACGSGSGFNMAAVIIPGISAESTRACVKLAEKSPILYAAVGIHPNSVIEAASGDWEVIESLVDHAKVVGIGETGLDKYWDRSPLNMQIEYLEKHIDLAKRKNLPIIIHSREADDELLPILKREAEVTLDSAKENRLRGVIHAFSSTPEIAAKWVEYGFCISFAGSVTYTNRKFEQLWEAAKIIPADRLLLETDSPYLTPHPYRGKIDKNEPLMVAFTARRLAELRNCSVEEIAEQTTENAKRLFFTVEKTITG
ncbi:MAG: TatD family hydrolase [Thermoguttaceae bacterium]